MIIPRSWRVIAAVPFFAISLAANADVLPDVTLESFRARVHEWFAQHARETSQELLRNDGASVELNDLRWQLQDLLNQGATLTGFEDVGIRAREDGRSVILDLERFPQWRPFDGFVAGLANPELFRAIVPEMKKHGLSEKDLQTLTTYLTNTDLDARRFRLSKSLFGTYSRVVDAEEAEAHELSRAYVYEATHKRFELDHAWAVGLFDQLDQRGQRAIAAAFDESTRRTTLVMGSDGKPEEITGRFVAMFRSAQFQTHMQKEDSRYSKPRSLNFSLEPPAPVEEAQDPAWSHSMQIKLEQFFANHSLADRFDVVSVDCRTTYCDIKAEGKLDAKPYDAFAQAVYDVSQSGLGLIRRGGGSAPNRELTMYEMHEKLQRESHE